MWTSKQIKFHKEAAESLLKIKDLTFEHIRKNKGISELEVRIFILEKFKEFGLVTADQPQIVAFGSNSAIPHYYPTKKTNKVIKLGDVIKIDIWARINKKDAPFADITWMGFYGNKIPQKVQKIFDIVISARDKSLKFLKRELKKKNIPKGKEIDRIVRDYIHHHGYGDKFIHGTGHSLGLHNPHGNLRKIRKSSQKPLYQNVAYTIEPGIYLDRQFGVRSEIDFYITAGFKLVITTSQQKNLVSVYNNTLDTP